MQKDRAGLVLLLMAAGCGAEAQTQRQELAASQDSFVARRVWSGGDWVWGGVSPDGRWVSTPDSATGDMAVLDFATGALRRLTNVDEPWGRRWAENSAVSHDGRYVAYAFGDATGDSLAWELRVVAAGGGEDRVIARFSDGYYVEPIGWMAGDSAIVVQRTRAEHTDVATISRTTGEVRPVRHLGPRYAWASVSPDGRLLAYSYPEKPDARSHDLHLLDLASGQSTVVAASSSDEVVLGWLDAHTLLYSTDASGAPAIVSSEIHQGRATGQPRLVRNDVWGLAPFGAFRDGLLYRVTTETQALHSVRIDPVTGAGVGDADVLTAGVTEAVLASAWSPDGGQIAYFAAPQIRIRSADGSQERKLAPVFSHVGDLFWSSDRRALYAAGTRAGTTGTFRLDPATGSVEYLGAGYFTPDGRRRIERRVIRGDERTLVVTDLESQRERVVVERLPANTGALSMHPAGAHVAMPVNPSAPGQRARMIMIDLADGAVRDLTTLPAGRELDRRASIAWSNDGRRILYVSVGDDGSDRTLHSLAIDGGTPVDVIRMPNLSFVEYHPSEHRIMFSAGSRHVELWQLRRVRPR